jgi:hypothetical protein
MEQVDFIRHFYDVLLSGCVPPGAWKVVLFAPVGIPVITL